jgi:tRNA (guanine26-N2/guanine27-N2)-dimethyltransferase
LIQDSLWQTEGKAQFKVGNTFYRSASQVVRDLGVLAATIYRQDTGSLRVLDAMAGCGVRSLRYWLESGADSIWANEGNPENSPILGENLAQAIAQGSCQLTHLDANRVFFDCYNQRNYYDVVDLDCFGSAVPYLSTSLWATKINGLLYITSTDGRTATGHLPEKSVRVYGACARAHPAAQEQALRLLIGSTLQQAATKGLGIQPVFALFAGQTYRVMLRLLPAESLTPENYGFLGHCHHCGDYQTVTWRQLGRVACPHDGEPLTLSGPMWLGALHDRPFLLRMQSLAEKNQWLKRVQLLEIMAEEAELPPYFYPLGEIGRQGQMDTPKRSRLIEALQQRGYRATRTHINPEAIKTDANLLTCINVARDCQD